MPAGEYDIFSEQGTTFNLSLTYKDSNNNAIDLASYTGHMQVRRSINDKQAIMYLTGTAGGMNMTGGGPTGEFTVGSTAAAGILGTGGIQLNTSSTGGIGHTGGIYISVDFASMKNVPAGNHVYDIELVSGSTVDRILKGRFEVDAEVTK